MIRTSLSVALEEISRTDPERCPPHLPPIEVEQGCLGLQPMDRNSPEALSPHRLPCPPPMSPLEIGHFRPHLPPFPHQAYSAKERR